MENANQSSDERPEYQHFIPRFILRGFLDPQLQQPNKSQKTRRARQGKKNKDGTLRIIDLETGHQDQRRLSKHFGLEDMYKDPGYVPQQDIERKLRDLERKAGQIISEARKTFTDPKAVLKLTRVERNELRRFLFLMKYRNRRFHERFYCQSIDDYVEDDKDLMREYMEQKGFTSPRQVWYHNLRHFITFDMDVQKQWTQTLSTEVYPLDAGWFRAHVEMSYMAFCRPGTNAMEFLLTENAYGIFEGPSNTYYDHISKTTTAGAYAEWHTFAPLSSSLLVVLRSNLLPGGPMSNLPFNQAMYSDIASQFTDSTLMLQDLPIKRPGTTFPLDDFLFGNSHVQPSGKDIFTFECFTLSRKHMNTINSILLEEAWKAKSIVYTDGKALFNSLKVDLETGETATKTFPAVDTVRLKYLKTLESIARELEPKASLQPQLHLWDMTHS